MKQRLLAMGIALLAFLPFGASALAEPMGFINPLPGDGSAVHNGWNSLSAASNPGFPGFPGFGAWPHPINSQYGSSDGTGSEGAWRAGAQLHKVSNGEGGGPYPSTSTPYLYSGGADEIPNVDGGALAVRHVSPVEGLANVVFQIQIGENLGYDFYDQEWPVLSFNEGNQRLEAQVWVLEQYNDASGAPQGPPQEHYINTYLLQWDLSGIEDAIAQFEIEFSVVQHMQLHAMRLDQSAVFSTAVPEPAGLSLLGMATLCLGFLRRKHIHHA